MILLLGQVTMMGPEQVKNLSFQNLFPDLLKVIENTSLKHFHNYLNMQVKKSGRLVSDSAPWSFLLKILRMERARLQQPVGTPELGPGVAQLRCKNISYKTTV